MTSPPYWGLRDYGVKGQIGLEKHPKEYVEKLASIFHDLKRVLKPHGSFYLNLGDTYYGGASGNNFDSDTGSTAHGSRPGKRKIGGGGYGHIHRTDITRNGGWLQPKQLLMIPTRVAIALQEDGWVLRNDIIWYKPNGLPSSVKDRLANKYEHVFHFVKSRRYYYDLDSIRVPQETLGLTAGKGRFHNHQVFDPYDNQRSPALGFRCPGGMVQAARVKREKGALRLLRADGKNPRDVFSARSKTARLLKISSMRNPPEPGEAHAFHALGKNPGDFFQVGDGEFELCRAAVLDSYAKLGKTGCKRFPGKHELLDPNSACFRVALNSGQMRNSGYGIINGLKVSAELKQRLKNWWHDHSSHWLGPNPGDFWKISTKPFPGAHFAVYPEDLCMRSILSSCPPRVCRGCAKPAQAIFQTRAATFVRNWRKDAKLLGMPLADPVAHIPGGHTGLGKKNASRKIVGWKTCACNAGFEPGIVFDPFAGAGTTLLVAEKLGRRWLGCELNPKFVRMANRRLSHLTTYRSGDLGYWNLLHENAWGRNAER